jgi:hypothetical protein
MANDWDAERLERRIDELERRVRRVERYLTARERFWIRLSERATIVSGVIVAVVAAVAVAEHRGR